MYIGTAEWARGVQRPQSCGLLVGPECRIEKYSLQRKNKKRCVNVSMFQESEHRQGLRRVGIKHEFLKVQIKLRMFEWNSINTTRTVRNTYSTGESRVDRHILNRYEHMRTPGWQKSGVRKQMNWQLKKYMSEIYAQKSSWNSDPNWDPWSIKAMSLHSWNYNLNSWDVTQNM